MNDVELVLMNKSEPCLAGTASSSTKVDRGVNAGDTSVEHQVDREDFDAIYLRYKDKIVNYQFSLVRDIEIARDLAQTTLIRAWKKFPTLRDESRFSPWVYTIARNVVYDYWRSERKVMLCSWESLTEQQTMISVQGPEEAVELIELIRLALTTLAPKYRACLLLYAVYGCSAQEIAKLVGISKASVPIYLCTARRQFRLVYLRLRCE